MTLLEIIELWSELKTGSTTNGKKITCLRFEFYEGL